jgi:sec-independent protein translocase protein TatC
MSVLAGLRRVRIPGLGGRPRTGTDSRMTLIEHLLELRSRLTKATLGVVSVSIVIGVFAYDELFRIVKHPYCQLPAKYRPALGLPPGPHTDGCTLFATGATDQFTFRLKLALFGGLLLSSPIWVYQLWAYVAPGLHRRERRWTYLFVGISSALFAAGALLAYFLLGKTLEVLLSVGGGHITTLLDVNKYVSFALGLLLVFGVGFEFPLVLSLLNLAGVLPSQRMRQWRRIVYFAMFVFAAVATPSQDPFTMCFLAVPLCLLYEVAVLVGRLHDRTVRRREAASPFAGLADDETSLLHDTPEPVEPGAPVTAGGVPSDDVT